MSSIVNVYDDFLSENIRERIENEIMKIKVKDYKDIKSLLKWLPKEIVKEKNVIKYSEKVSKIRFEHLSKDTRCHVAIKHGFSAADTQIHFDNRVFLNIVVPIFMREIESSGLIIFPYFSSILLRPFLKYKFISKILRKIKFLQIILQAQNIEYIPNKGYLFKGNVHAHGVFFRPLSKDSLRAVLTINFKRY